MIMLLTNYHQAFSFAASSRRARDGPYAVMQGVHPPETMMHFPLFQIFASYFRKIFRLRGKFFHFHPPKFMMTFLSSTTNLLFSPYFRCFITFPPISEKLLFPLLLQIPSDFLKFKCFYVLSVFFVSPSLTMMHLGYASHNARTGRPCGNVTAKRGDVSLLYGD